MHWWDMWPERLDHELNELRQKGWEPKDITSDEQKAKGVRKLEITYRQGDHEVPITLHFPPDYPFFKAHAYLNTEIRYLARHHNPITGELCLIANQNGWRPSTSMADLLLTNMPKLLEIASEPASDFALKHEEPQGEPLIAYLDVQPDTAFLVADLAPPNGLTKGRLIAHRLSNQKEAKFALTRVMDGSGRNTNEATELAEVLKTKGTIEGVWKKIDVGALSELKELNNPEAVCRLVSQFQYDRMRHSHTSKSNFLFAAIFDQEIAQGKYGVGWRVIYVRAVKSNDKRKKGITKLQLIPLRFEEYSIEHRRARIPDVVGIENKSVTIVGCGMLGGTIALKLAQAGIGKISLIDGDTIDASTTVRYALGLKYSGTHKVSALKSYIEENYPFTDVTAVTHMLGGPVYESTSDTWADSLRVIEAADIIVDSAAEASVSYFLNHQSLSMKKPMIVVTTRPGTWGGEVWNLSDSAGPCWGCLQRYQVEGQLPFPNGDDETPNIQPGGCASLTTEGYGFDCDIIALNAVRAIVGQLTNDAGYPKPSWSALNINLRSSKNAHTEEQTTQFKLSKHPDCAWHEK